MQNLYQYLHNTFCKAIMEGFPGIFFQEDLLRFYIVDKNDFDICTPIAKRLSSFINNSHSADKIAHRLFQNISWDSSFVKLCDSSTISDGFINILISDNYLLKMIQNTSTTDIIANNSTLSDSIANPIYSKLLRLITHALRNGLLNATSIADSTKNFLLLSEKIERKLLILLCRKAFPEQLANKQFYSHKLYSITNEYYMTVPIITADRKVSIQRLCLIKMILEEITCTCIDD